MLACDGHDVLVLERDYPPARDAPDRAWTDRDGPAVRQFRLGHLLLPAGREALKIELPETVAGFRRLPCAILAEGRAQESVPTWPAAAVGGFVEREVR